MESDSGEIKDAMEVVVAEDDSSNVVQETEEDTAAELTPNTSDVATNTDEPNNVRPVAVVQPRRLDEDSKQADSLFDYAQVAALEYGISRFLSARDNIPGPTYTASPLCTSSDAGSSSSSDGRSSRRGVYSTFVNLSRVVLFSTLPPPPPAVSFYPGNSLFFNSTAVREGAIYVEEYIRELLSLNLRRIRHDRSFMDPSNVETRRRLRRNFRSVLSLLRNLTTDYARSLGCNPMELTEFRQLRSLYLAARRIGRSMGRSEAPRFPRENSETGIEGDADDSEAEDAPARNDVDILPAVERFIQLLGRNVPSGDNSIPIMLDGSSPYVQALINERRHLQEEEEEQFGVDPNPNRSKDN
ncbi:hypothetical protein KR067_013549 [Drosophila pandora]|nr:hypothetical protein KR067_013549 [Drosophila pandora]